MNEAKPDCDHVRSSKELLTELELRSDSFWATQVSACLLIDAILPTPYHRKSSSAAFAPSCTDALVDGIKFESCVDAPAPVQVARARTVARTKGYSVRQPQVAPHRIDYLLAQLRVQYRSRGHTYAKK